MNTHIKSNLGWITAASLALFIFASGFQSAQEKTAIVDLNKVIQDSTLGKANTQRLNAALTARRGLMDFILTYPVITVEQANTMKTLTLKAAATEADKAQIERIRKDVLDSDKRRSDLLTKQNLTEADRQLLNEYSQRARAVEELAQSWDREFTSDMANLREELQSATVTAAKASLNQVARAQGYTIVIESTFAPYGANDLTAATITALNNRR